MLNNPTTLTDPLGLQNGCIPAGMNAHGSKTPNCPVLPSGPDFGVGGTGWDEFDLMDIRVYGDATYTPEGWQVGANQVGWGIDLLGPAFPSPSGSTSGTFNSRNCTVGPASTKQYLSAAGQVVAMTAEFFSGLGPGNPTFAPNSATSQVMAQSAGAQSALNSYFQTGQTSGLYTFGLSGLVAAGGNPVAQFVGSFRWSVTPVNGGINLAVTNTTSFRSLTYDIGPQWQRGSFPTPMGNTHQTYNITATCH